MLLCYMTSACRWCLDKSGLTIPLAILIIAFGGAVLVFAFILILVFREVKKNNGKVQLT